nr:hypothetical protein [Thermoanaerobaculia bacterium]
MPQPQGRCLKAGNWIAAVFAVAVAVLPCAAHAGTGVWTSQGPYGATVHSLAIDPVTPSSLYAGTSR